MMKAPSFISLFNGGGLPSTALYTNWKGETDKRRIQPIRLWYGETEFHPEPQWLVTALDLDKNQVRDFALKDMTPIDWAAE